MTVVMKGIRAAVEGVTRSLRTARSLVGATVALMATLACASSSRQPDMVLWIVDTLRADRLGLYGFERPVSPHYDAAAAQSTVFEAAFAQSSWTRPAVASMLTGVSPIRHGVHVSQHSLGEDWELLTERLRELGYATAGFVANGNVQEKFGFDQGFDHFWFVNRAPAETLIDQALGWLDNLRIESPGQPFFMMILSVEPHDGYEPAEPFRSRFASGVVDPALGTVPWMQSLRKRRLASNPDPRRRAAEPQHVVEGLFQLYEAEVAWSDHEFGRFRLELERRGLDPSLVVVADHGEAFGEHGFFGHLDLHDEVHRIPFFVHLPGQTKGYRVHEPVHQVDILPSLLELAGGAVPDDVDGSSLLPLMAGKTGAAEHLIGRPIVSVSLLERPDLHPTYSLVSGRWKLIWRKPRSVQLFDRFSDQAETVDVADQKPVVVRHLLRVLQQEIEAAESRSVDSIETDLDEETRRQLKAMGYVD